MKLKGLHSIYFFLLILFLYSTKISAQVGIGTTSPNTSAVLDVVSENNNTGVLFPRMTTVQRDAIASPATGLLIFNTTTSMFNYNMGVPATPNWVSLSRTNRAARFGGGNDITTNLNTAAFVNVPIFNVFFFNDDTTLYSASPANQNLTIGEAGRYMITVHVPLSVSFGTQDNINIIAFLNVNGSNIGAGFSRGSGYISNANGNTQGTINFTDVIELSVGDILSVQVQAEGNTLPTVVNTQINGSGFFIEKLN